MPASLRQRSSGATDSVNKKSSQKRASQGGDSDEAKRVAKKKPASDENADDNAVLDDAVGGAVDAVVAAVDDDVVAASQARKAARDALPAKRTPKAVYKKKPAKDDDDEDAVVDEDEDGDEDSFHAKKASPARRKSVASPAAPAVSAEAAEAAAAAAPAAKRGRGTKRAGGGRAAGGASADASSLVQALNDKTALAVVVSEWHAEYKQKGDAAMLALVNSLLELCGSSVELSLAQYVEGQGDDNMKFLDSAVVSSTADYAVHGKAKPAVTLRERLDTFWQRVATTLVRNESDDTAPLDALISWLTAISSSAVRAFRHTATLAALSVELAVARVAHDDVKQLATARRQSAASQKRSGGGGGGASGRAAPPAAEELLARRVGRYDQLLSDIFDGVLVHRYRDSVPDIRAACAAALGELMLAHADAFLEDKYLKYLGWLLYDREAAVREAAVEALRGVYAAHADTNKLANFSLRFKPRVLEMADDKDETVAAAAVGLCLHLAQTAGALEHAEVVKLYERTTDSRPRVRAAAARFANDYFLESIVPDNIGADEDLQEAQLKALVELVVEFTPLPDNPAYLVDALFASAPALSAWSKMARLLEAPAACDLEPTDALPLARMLAAAARKASGDVVVPGGVALGAQKLHKKQREAVDAARDAIARELGTALPKLLVQYGGDAAILAELAALIPCMNLSRAASRASLKALADALAAALARAVAADTIEAIAVALRFALTTPHTHVAEFVAAHAALTEQLDAAAVAALAAELERHTEQHAANALVALDRLVKLRQQVAPPTVESTQQLADALDRFLAARTADAAALAVAPPLTAAAAAVFAPLVMWRGRDALTALADARKGTPAKKSAPDADAEPPLDSGAALDAAKLKVAALGVPLAAAFAYLERLLEAPAPAVRREAYALAASLAMLFCAQRPRNALTSQLPATLAGALDAHVDAVLRLAADADLAAWFEPIVIDPAEAEDELDELQCDTLSSYAALVIAGALDSTAAVRVYRQFTHANKRVQAVARVLQKRLRDTDARLEFEWINRTLEAVYADAVAAEADAARDEPRDMTRLHALAVRLAQSYGIGAVPPKLVRSLVLVIVEGLGYATQPIAEAFQRAQDGGADVELDELATRDDLCARFDFIGTALEPFAARLPAAVSARVYAVANDIVAKLHLRESEPVHAAFFDFARQLEGATKGRRIKTTATPATAAVKKALKLDAASTAKKAPVAKPKKATTPASKRKAAWYDENDDGDGDGDADEEEEVAPARTDRPARRAAAAAATKKNRTAADDSDDGLASALDEDTEEPRKKSPTRKPKTPVAAALDPDNDADDDLDDKPRVQSPPARKKSPSRKPKVAAALDPDNDADDDLDDKTTRANDDDGLVSAADDLDAALDEKLRQSQAKSPARQGAQSQEPQSQPDGAAKPPKSSVATTVVPRVVARRKK